MHYKKGKFASVSPTRVVGRSGIGAWQLAARYSTIDLNDADINGGGCRKCNDRFKLASYLYTEILW